MTIATLIDPVYNFKFIFICKTDKDKALAYLKEFFPDCYFEDNWKKAGFAYVDNESGIATIVIPDRKPTWDITTILAHEVLHITSRVLRCRGITLCDESEEAFTYHLTWLMQSLTDIYRRSKKQMKSKSKAVSKKRK